MTRGVQDVQVAVRMPSALVAELDRWGAERGASRAELLREAAAAYLHHLRCERDAAIYDRQPLTDDELAPGDSDAVRSTIPPWDEDAPW